MLQVSGVQTNSSVGSRIRVSLSICVWSKAHVSGSIYAAKILTCLVVLLSHWPPYSRPMFLLCTFTCGSTGLGWVTPFTTGFSSFTSSCCIEVDSCTSCCWAHTEKPLLLRFLGNKVSVLFMGFHPTMEAIDDKAAAIVLGVLFLFRVLDYSMVKISCFVELGVDKFFWFFVSRYVKE